MTSRETWKAAERRVASFFNTERTPLSGGNSKITKSDTLSDNLFIEVKYRKNHSVIKLWDRTKELARKEDKTPVIALVEKNRDGFWILVKEEDLSKL